MKRFNIKPNHSTALPRRIVCFDTETIREQSHVNPLHFNHYLRNGCLISLDYNGGNVRNRHVVHFDDSRQFWQWLDAIASKQYTTWIVAHKMSFDFTVVGGWKMIADRRLKLDQPRAKRPITDGDEIELRKQRGLCVIDDPPFVLGLSNDSGGRMVFVDTLNWFRCPLRELGTGIGLEKLQMPDSFAAHSEWQSYCQRDAEIVERAFTGLIDFFGREDCGMFRYTAPSQAMAAFRHSHMHHKIVLHDEADVKKLERDSYFGGEVRVFYHGLVEKHLTQVDVNGMYPYVMRENYYPRSLLHWTDDDKWSNRPWFNGLHLSIAQVEISDISWTYPVRDGTSVSYCNGDLTTTFAGPELVFANEINAIKRYGKTAVYSCDYIFRTYIDHFHSLRVQFKQDGNLIYAELCKMLLTNLYGKFGQKAYRWMECLHKLPPSEWAKWCEINCDTGKVTNYRSIGPYVFEEQEPGESINSFPAISSFATSYARVYMARLRQIAGKEHVYYQANDSLIVDDHGLMLLKAADMLHPTELGKLKIEREGMECEILGPNNYRIGDKKVRSGLRESAVEISSGKWFQEFFENADSQVARNPDDCIRSHQTIFSARNNPTKYVRSKEGWTTPIRIVAKSATK